MINWLFSLGCPSMGSLQGSRFEKRNADLISVLVRSQRADLLDHKGQMNQMNTIGNNSSGIVLFQTPSEGKGIEKNKEKLLNEQIGACYGWKQWRGGEHNAEVGVGRQGGDESAPNGVAGDGEKEGALEGVREGCKREEHAGLL